MCSREQGVSQNDVSRHFGGHVRLRRHTLDRLRLRVVLFLAVRLFPLDAHAHCAHEVGVVELVDLVDGHVTRVTSRRRHVTTAQRIHDGAQDRRAGSETDLTNATRS